MSLNDPENFQGRVDFAAAVIARNGTPTRNFDNCFENFDGDAVAAALVRRAERNPQLAANLTRYLGPSAQEAAAKLAGRKLTQAAREMRQAGRESFARFMAEFDAKKAEEARA